MKIKSLILLISFITTFPVAAFSGEALNPNSNEPTKLQIVNCFDYYRFGSVQVSLNASVISVIPGVPLTFNAKVLNSNPYPIVDGAVFVKIFRRQPQSKNGPLMVDQFFAKEGISVAAKGSQQFNFTWQVPSFLPAGDYQAATFFVVAKKFNLLGLSFTDDVIGNNYNFSIVGKNPKPIAFDKDSVIVDNHPFYFATAIPTVTKNKPVTVRARLSNPTGKSERVLVTWKVYSWDGLREEALIETYHPIVTVPSEGEYATVTIIDTKHSVYYVVGEAQYKDTKSIIGVRFARSDMSTPRLNFPAVTSFPLEAGKPAEVFSCLHGAGTLDTVPGGKLVLDLLDPTGQTIQTYTYEGDLTGAMMAVKSGFTPKRNYGTFILKASLFEKGVLVDEASLTYDCRAIDKATCPPSGESGIVFFVTVALLAAVLVGAGFVIKKLRGGSSVPPATAIGIVFALAIAASAFFAPGPVSAQEEVVTWTSSIAPPSILQTAILLKPLYYWQHAFIAPNEQPFPAGWTPGLYSSNTAAAENITVMYYVTATDITNASSPIPLSPGAPVLLNGTVRFHFEPHVKEHLRWNGTGWTTDTPFGQWQASAALGFNDTSTPDSTFLPFSACDYSNDSVGYREYLFTYIDPESKLKVTFTDSKDIFVPFRVNPPTESFSNIVGLSCNQPGGPDAGGNIGDVDCKVTSTGTVGLTFNFSATQGKFYHRYFRNQMTKEPGGCYGNSLAMRLAPPVANNVNSGSDFILNVPAINTPFFLTAVSNNTCAAPTITGPSSGYTNTSYTFYAQSVDPQGDSVRYGFDWNNDGIVDVYAPTSGYTTSGTNQSAVSPSSLWQMSGTYQFRVYVEDNRGATGCVASKSITVSDPAGAPDLTADAPYVISGILVSSNPRTYVAGTNISVVGDVYNIGTAPVTVPFNNRFEWSTLASGPWSNGYAAYNNPMNQAGSLAVGSRAKAYYPYVSFSSPGTYYVRLCADSDRMVSREKNTGNNCSAALTLTVVNPPQPPTVSANRPTCKAQGSGAVEVYILSQTTSATQYKIRWKKSTDSTYPNNPPSNPITIQKTNFSVQSDGRLLYVVKSLDPSSKYNFEVSEGYSDGTWSSFVTTSPSPVESSACDQETISLACSGLSGYLLSSQNSCVAEYNGPVRLAPTGTFWDSCTPTSAPKHDGFDGATWQVSSPSVSSVGDNSGYKDFSASGGAYKADSLISKEYTFYWDCSKTKAGSTNPPSKRFVSVCVLPPVVNIIGSSPDFSTVVVTWNKPAVHSSFGLRYVLNIDRLSSNPRIINISNTDTQYCDSFSRPGAPYGQCSYRDTNLSSGDIHSYQLQVLADNYTKCNPIATLLTQSEIYIPVSTCTIDLKVNGGYSISYPGNTNNAKFTWTTTNIPTGGICKIIGNLPGFSGTVNCASSQQGSSPTVDMSKISAGNYSGLLAENSGYCSSNSVDMSISSVIDRYELKANPEVVELVAVGSAKGKNLVSSPTTIRVIPQSGFLENVTLSFNPVQYQVQSFAGDKPDSAQFKFAFSNSSNSIVLPYNGTSQLKISSKNSDLPIPDGRYKVTIRGITSSNILRTVDFELRVRTVAPTYKEY